MKPRARPRDALAALRRKTLGKRPAVSAVDLGTDEQLPKMSVLSPQQRRTIIEGRPPPK